MGVFLEKTYYFISAAFMRLKEMTNELMIFIPPFQ